MEPDEDIEEESQELTFWDYIELGIKYEEDNDDEVED